MAGAGAGSVTSSIGDISCARSSGTSSGACSATIDSGSTVTISQATSTGSVFGGWSGACNGTGACDITMTQAATVTATFNVIAANGLVARFPLDGNANDASGNGYNGIATGSPATTTDRANSPNGAIAFDGLDDEISIPAGATNDMTSGTITLWLRLADTTKQYNVFGKLPNNTDWLRFQFAGAPGSATTFYFLVRGENGNNGSASSVPATGSYGFTNWHMYTFTWTATQKRIYLDRTLLSTFSGSFGPTASSGNLLLGHESTGNAERTKGSMDEFRIYNRSLSQTEVEALYDSLAPPSAVASVSVTPGGAALSSLGATTTLTATPRDANNNSISGQSVSWASLNTTIATVNPSTGVVTGVAPGQATISATVGGKAGYALVSVSTSSATPVNLWVGTQITSLGSVNLWGAADTAMYAGGSYPSGSEVFKFNGTSWSKVYTGGGNNFVRLWGSAANDVWATGNFGAFARLSGTTWFGVSNPGCQLFHIWGAAPNAVFTGCNGATVYRYNGSAWSAVATPPATSSDMYGFSAADLWTVTGDTKTVQRFDGSAWAVAQTFSNEVAAIWGSSPSDVWVAGNNGFARRWNGTSWVTPGTPPATASFRGIWGTGSNDVYMTDASTGQIHRYDGSSWTSVLLEAGGLDDIWGTGSSVWAAGNASGKVWRGYRGATVSVTPASPNLQTGGTQQLTATAKDAQNATVSGATITWSSSNNSVATVSSAGVVTAVSIGSATITATALGGASSGVVVSVAAASGIYRDDFTGTSLTAGWQARGGTWSVGSGVLTGLGTGQVELTRTNAAGTPKSIKARILNTPGAPLGAAGLTFNWVSANAYYGIDIRTNNSAASAYIYRITASGGQNLTSCPTGLVATNRWYVLQLTDTDNGLVGQLLDDADGTLLCTMTAPGEHINNAEFGAAAYSGGGEVQLDWIETDMAAPPVFTQEAIGGVDRVNSIWRVSDSDLWVTRNNLSGSVAYPMHNTTGTWGQPTTFPTVIYKMWGASATDLFAGGWNGTLMRYNGSTWTNVNTSVSTSAALYDTWGSSSSNVFAVGDNGTVLRFNGTGVVSQSSGTSNHLVGVWGSGASDAWAVGWSGTITRYNGASWSTVSSGTTQQLNGVWGSSASTVFAVGNGGVILRWNGTSWSSMTSGVTSDLLRVWGRSASEVYAVGSSGTLLKFNGTAWSTVTLPTSQDLLAVGGLSSGPIYIGGNNGVLLKGTP